MSQLFFDRLLNHTAIACIATFKKHLLHKITKSILQAQKYHPEMVDHRFRIFNNITEVMMKSNQSSVLTKHIQHFFNNSILQELNTINATATPEGTIHK